MALDALGLPEIHERVYRTLVELSAASVEEVAPRCRVTVAEADSVLTDLSSRGMVTRSRLDGTRFIPSPPDVALAALLVERQEALRRAGIQIAELSAAYATSGGRRGTAEVLDSVRGVEAITQRFAQLQRGATTSVHALVKASAVAPVDDDVEADAIARGVKYNLVVEREVFDKPGFLAAAEEVLRLGTQIRVVPTVPLRALIVDRSLALIPLSSRDAPEAIPDALLVHPSGLLDVLLTAFDLIWEGASVLGLVHGFAEEVGQPDLDPLDVRVLSLLFAGLTDQAVANQLGLSLRTVQRRVRMMMDRAGVDTRLQLGHEAGRRGWI
ncbi:MAG: helix-turn-helix domain-containing protein [Nocardioides sp.]